MERRGEHRPDFPLGKVGKESVGIGCALTAGWIVMVIISAGSNFDVQKMISVYGQRERKGNVLEANLLVITLEGPFYRVNELVDTQRLKYYSKPLGSPIPFEAILSATCTSLSGGGASAIRYLQSVRVECCVFA